MGLWYDITHYCYSALVLVLHIVALHCTALVDCPYRMINRFGLGYSGYGMGLNMDPYSLGMNPYMNGMNPMMMGGGMCMDMSAQCPVWASTGQCATNPMYMQRTCGRSCGTCLGMGMGLGMGYGLGGLGGYGLGMGGINPYGLGRSIYETGILRSQPKPAILANEDVKQIKFNNEALTIPRQKLL
ncbi:unnamed protein product [Auanema sp. JU1783]|nr:unnamed protein product [Auanema sp. JU1783]